MTQPFDNNLVSCTIKSVSDSLDSFYSRPGEFKAKFKKVWFIHKNTKGFKTLLPYGFPKFTELTTDLVITTGYLWNDKTENHGFTNNPLDIIYNSPDVNTNFDLQNCFPGIYFDLEIEAEKFLTRFLFESREYFEIMMEKISDLSEKYPEAVLKAEID